MQIHFCDLCNESVPQSDLDEGKAWQHGERVVCSTCQRLMSEGARAPLPARASSAAAGAGVGTTTSVAIAERPLPGPSSAAVPASTIVRPPAEAARPSGVGGALFLALVALIVAVGAAAVMFDRFDTGQQELAGADEDLRAKQGELSQKVSGFEKSLAARFEASERRGSEERVAQFAGLSTSLSELREEIARLSQRIDNTGRDLALMRDSQGDTSKRAGERATQVASQFSELEGQLAFHNDKLIELEERVHALAQGSALIVAAPGAAPGAGVPGWQPLLADLSSAQPSVRLDALYALGKSEDLAVVPYVVPLLEDADLFVRMAAARVLEDLKAKAAVPALIDALEDPEAVVTEGAMFALKKITDKDFGFEPNAAPAERAKKVKLWRDWWKKEGEAFLAGDTPIE